MKLLPISLFLLALTGLTFECIAIILQNDEYYLGSFLAWIVMIAIMIVDSVEKYGD